MAPYIGLLLVYSEEDICSNLFTIKFTQGSSELGSIHFSSGSQLLLHSGSIVLTVRSDLGVLTLPILSKHQPGCLLLSLIIFPLNSSER